MPYLSPERATGFTTLDVRSDVYAMGVLLFEVLTETYPYDVVGNKEVARENIIRAKPLSLREGLALGNSLSSLNPGELDNDLQAIVSMAIAKDKHDRYQSAAALADDLDRYLTGGVVQARIDQRWYLAKRMMRKYRIQAAATAVVFALLIWSNLRTRTHQLAAQQERDSARKFASLAQSTLGHLVTKVDEEIGSLAGGKVVRQSLLNDVADRLHEMNGLVGANASLASLSISLHEKQGDVARSDGRAKEAEAYYLQAAGELDDADDESVQAIRARLYRKAGNASADGRAHFQLALENARASGIHEELARVLVDAARDDYLRGEHAQAGRYLDEALNLLNERIDDERLLARALEWDGGIRIKLGDLSRSRDSLLRSLEIRERLLTDRPFDVRLKRRHMIASTELGTVLAKEGNYEDAIAHASSAVSTGKYLHSIDASNPDYRQGLISSSTRLASVYRKSGDVVSALDAANASVAWARSFLEDKKKNTQVLRQLGFAMEERSRINHASSHLVQSLEDAQSALAVRKSLSETQPENFDFKAELAKSRESVGSCLQRVGRHVEAYEYLLAALHAHQGLLNIQPNVPDRVKRLAAAGLNLSAWHIRRKTQLNDDIARELLKTAENLLLSRWHRLSTTEIVFFAHSEKTALSLINASTKLLLIIEQINKRFAV
ncbi:MAG: hypothetical protein GXP29_06440 [Planctomycetes bacterium]|nr:hypothetical protein [Planctomycetota bacterium]